jgi:hypothetical protein
MAARRVAAALRHSPQANRRMTATTAAATMTAKMMPPGRQVPSPLPDACEAVHCCKQKKQTLESKNGFCQLAWRE